MHFDFCIGNPPYQEEVKDTSDKPVYNYFLDAAPKFADKVELIHPARFLFNAGKTPKEWNKKMLEDEHFKIMEYEQNSKKIFNGVDITGGLAISYYDNDKNFGAINTFTLYKELNSILLKVRNKSTTFLDSLCDSAESFKFTDVMYSDFPFIEELASKGHKYDITSNSFEKLLNIVFFLEKPNDKKFYIKVYGRLNGKRHYFWINRDYVFNDYNISSWKVFMSASNGAAGTIGDKPARIVGKAVVAEPYVGHGQTFISIGNFKTEFEAKSCGEYIETKFARLLIGILKVTQTCKKGVYANVPLQDFTNRSDIDWTKSASEIDLQLYKKYGFSDEEIQFIESKIK